MKTANDTRDSDQCAGHQQRSRAVLRALVVLIAIALGGCLGKGTRPASNQEAAFDGQGPETPLSLQRARGVAPDDLEHDDAIWSRLRQGFRLGHIDHPRIEEEILRLQRSPNGFRTLMARSEPYLHHILDKVEQAGMPTELALLPAVESGFRPHVYSPDGAAGLWQFMPVTGRMLGLKQDWWYDKRRTIRPSTDAAIAYLRQLNERFDGDWLYTLAAYNAGGGTVSRAIRRAGARGEDTRFWSLDLPGETDRYIPRLLALSAIVADPGRYGMDLPEIIDRPYFAAAHTGGQIDLNVAAELADMPVDDLLALNAGHKRWASRPEGPHELLLPIDKVDDFEAAVAELPTEKRLRWERYTIQPGDSLSRIARRFGVSVDAVSSANDLKDSRIRAGRDLLIPMSDSLTFADTGTREPARQKLRYRVRKGDSLYAIARRFQVSVPDLKRWNEIGRHIRPGEKLTLFVDPDA